MRGLGATLLPVVLGLPVAVAAQSVPAGPFAARDTDDVVVLTVIDWDGAPVELLNNGTWRRPGEFSARSCWRLEAGVTFCGLDHSWSPLPVDDSAVSGLFAHQSARASTVFVIDPLPAGHGLEPPAMVERILAGRRAVTPGGIDEIDRYTPSYGDRTGITLAYIRRTEPPSATLHTVFGFDRLALQIVTEEPGETVSQRLMDLHVQVLDLTRLDN